MRIYPLTLAAGVAQEINAQGLFLRGLTGTAVYDLEAFDAQGQSLGLLADFQTMLAVDFSRPFVKLRVQSATIQAISILVHDRRVDDNRLAGIINITGGIDSKAIAPTVAVANASVSVGTSATAVVAAGTRRGAVTLQNTSTATIYVGLTSGVTTSTGIVLSPAAAAGAAGGAIDIATNTGIWAIASVAASPLRVMYAEYA